MQTLSQYRQLCNWSDFKQKSSFVVRVKNVYQPNLQHFIPSIGKQVSQVSQYAGQTHKGVLDVRRGVPLQKQVSQVSRYAGQTPGYAARCPLAKLL